MIRIFQKVHNQRLLPFLTAARVIEFIILMADYNPERIVYENHVNEIKWYSSFKCASDYR